MSAPKSDDWVWFRCRSHGVTFPGDQYQAHCTEGHGGKQIAVTMVARPLDVADCPAASGDDPSNVQWWADRCWTIWHGDDPENAAEAAHELADAAADRSQP